MVRSFVLFDISVLGPIIAEIKDCAWVIELAYTLLLNVLSHIKLFSFLNQSLSVISGRRFIGLLFKQLLKFFDKDH